MPARTRRTLANMIEHGFTSHARCPKCDRSCEVDLRALMAKAGPDYSLWNRRCRCRFTPGCPGWIRFKVGPGWYVPDYDEPTEERWMADEYREQLERDPALRAAVEKLRRTR